MPRNPPMTAELFMASVVKQPSGCWEWQGHIDSQTGYGLIKRRPFAQVKQAHRLAHLIFMGPIPAGLEIDHLCRNRRCVNPAHLEAVTHRENMRRGIAPAWQAHNSNVCKRGHSLLDAYRKKGSGWRQCRTCHRERQLARTRAAGVRPANYVTAEKVEHMAALRDLGWNNGQIGRELGFHGSTVLRALRKYLAGLDRIDAEAHETTLAWIEPKGAA